MDKKETMLQIYLYVVLSFSIIYGTILLGSGLWGTAKILFPEITIYSYQLERIEKEPIDVLKREGVPKETFEQKKQKIINLEKREGKRDILHSIIWLFIIIPVFIVHLIVLVRNRRKQSNPWVKYNYWFIKNSFK